MNETLLFAFAIAAGAGTLVLWALAARRGWGKHGGLPHQLRPRGGGLRAGVLLRPRGAGLRAGGFLRLRGAGLRAGGLVAPAAAAPPLVSILVPAWNEEALLARCLAALQRLEYPHWECVLAAGGSDRTLEVAASLAAADPRLTVVRQARAGKNAALNLALAEARGELVALLDADCVVEPSWLTRLVGAVADGADACLSDYQPTTLTWISRQFVIDKIAAYVVRGSTTLHGGAILLRRSAVEAIGGRFPETVMVGTDWDLDRRISRAGLRKAYVPGARHSTPYPATLRSFARNELRWRRAHVVASLQHLERTPRRVARGLVELVPYWLPWATLLAVVIAVVLPLTLSRPLPWTAWLAPLAVGGCHVWLLARRTGHVIEVAACTGDWRWLRYVWLPVLTTMVMLAAGGLATVTARRAAGDFTGPRPPRA